MKVSATIVSLLLVDKVGRRRLLLVGASCMAVCLLVLTVFAGYQYSILGYHHRETCTHVTTALADSDVPQQLPLQSNMSAETLLLSTTQQLNTSISDADLSRPPPPDVNTTRHLHKNVFSHVEHTPGSKQTGDLCSADNLPPIGLRYVAFLALVVYVAAFSVSFGPITWILLTELFPVSLKGDAMSLGQAVSWTANVFVSVTFLDSVRVLTLPFVFSVYLVFAVVAIVFIYRCVPETKGKSLEEISRELKSFKRSQPRQKRASASMGGQFVQLQNTEF